jgi:hypothetical protein
LRLQRSDLLPPWPSVAGGCRVALYALLATTA